MAHKYDTATDRMKLFEAEPLSTRRFELALIDANLLPTKRIDFDPTHATVSDILGGADDDTERVTLRTQMIPKPLNPASATSTSDKLLQFFAVDPNHNSLVERRMSAVLVERPADDSDDLPLFLLTPDEVWSIAHGEGFSAEISQEVVPTPPPPGP